MDNKIEQLVKIIDFWQKSIGKGILYKRKITADLDLSSKEIIDLSGPRRSGKSSVLKLIIRQLRTDNFLYINFEDPFFISHNNPEIIEDFIEVYKNYFQTNLKYLFFDEIQEIEHWEKVIRKLRDIEKYKIFITGSSSKLLSREISSLITGRHLSYKIFPLSFREYLLFNGVTYPSEKEKIINDQKIYKQFQNYMTIGGFPEPVLTKNVEILKNYFFDILQKDVVIRHNIREKEILEKIAEYLLSNSGKISSIESLKKTFSLSFSTTLSYLNYLKEAFLLLELPQFSFSLKKQEKALKKTYAIDCGLGNAVSFKFSQDKGRILENIVFLELVRNNNELYYYRTKNNLEVDFLIKERTKFRELIQVAWILEDEKINKREIKALSMAMDELKIKEGLILTNHEKDTLSINKKTITIKPVYQWLLEKK